MIALSANGISLAYGVNVIIEDVSFSINEGDRLGIVGVNGAGKSTLLKIITGQLEATSGNIYISKDKTVMMLSQNVIFESGLTVGETMLECYKHLIEEEKRIELLRDKLSNGNESDVLAYTAALERFTENGGFEYKGRSKGILKSLGFTEDMYDLPVNNLSGGQKTRLALGRLLFLMPDILVLDEPTNHLDITTLRWLEDYLSSYKKTLIVVSHDRYFLDRVATKILDIENKKATLYNGNYTAFIEKKKKNREIQLRHYQNQQKEIARIEAYIEQQRRWNRERNIIAAESRMKMLDRMERIDKPENEPEEIRISFPECTESGNDVLTVKGLSKAYGNKKLFDNLSFLVRKNERALIIGENGCGKSTLLKILTNNLEADKGESVFGYNVHLGYYDQENQNLSPEKTVLDELWDKFEKMTMTRVRTTLALFGFLGDDVFKKVSSLSGGEKARLTIAKLVLSKSNLLILDEPTNHLDISTREVLEEALYNYRGTIIAVSHDRYFINKIATRIIDFVSDSKINDYHGTYDEYINYFKKSVEKKQEIESPVSVAENKNDYLKNKMENANARKAKRRYEACKLEIIRLEERLEEIEAEIETNSTDHVKLTKLFEEKEETEMKLLELYEEQEAFENN
ncbi:MAG: ABC-F family ATP-binding cassette domain-containing protein [Ruminococcaceae bacterium]|nr:ABC-F family ATP-binding cassette domain-containing protein [Oscillospiraceae bacterium]